MTKVTNINKEEVKKTERQPNAMRGAIVIATVGVGVGLYGFMKGQQFGYNRGVKDGIIYANGQFLKATKQLAEAAGKESKGD